jgi:histidinol dehydrogenase
VDKIFGPGNAYVNEAKRQVFGRVGIDLQPGPSEVMVIADDGANPGHVAADLLAQAEHGTGKEKIYLIALSKKMIQAVDAAIAFQMPQLSHAEATRRVLDRHFFVVEVPSLEEAVEVANAIAPEHLELQVGKAHLPTLTRRITTAGAILLGYDTPTVLGDFVAGPSHTLPTGRTGRFFSGLRAVDYLRRTSVIEYGPKSLEKAAPAVGIFSELEQLDGHGKSLEIRLGKDASNGS